MRVPDIKRPHEYFLGYRTGRLRTIQLVTSELDTRHTAFYEEAKTNLEDFQTENHKEFVDFYKAKKNLKELESKFQDKVVEFEQQIAPFKRMLDREFDSETERVRAQRSFENCEKVIKKKIGLTDLEVSIGTARKAIDDHRTLITERFKALCMKNSTTMEEYNISIDNYLHGVLKTFPTCNIVDDQISEEELQKLHEDYKSLHADIFEPKGEDL